MANSESTSMTFDSGGQPTGEAVPGGGVEEAILPVTSKETVIDPNAPKTEPESLVVEGAAADAEEKPAVEGEEAPQEAVELPALPEFTPTDEASVAAYDARYTMADPDGEEGDEPVLNLEAFVPELEANMLKAEGAKAELNAASYAYLKARFGVSKQGVDTFIAGQIALKVQAEQEGQKVDTRLDELAGGEESGKALLSWASENLTQPQKDRFNAAMRDRLKDPDAAEAQIAWLKAKAGGAVVVEPKVEAPAAPAAPTSIRRGVNPKVNATKAAQPAAPGGAAAQPYATEAEYRADLNAAKGDDAKLKVTRARMAASPWFQAEQRRK